MMLLNGAAMFAGIAVIIPIVVHLRKRRKSKVIDWPAMQFLTRTVTNRRRGITLENLLLLLLRCLLVLLFVLAMARPVIEANRYLNWLAFFLLAGCGLMLLTMAIVSNWQRIQRTIGVVTAAVLFAIAGVSLSLGTESLMNAEVDRDVVFVIDCSLTMTLNDENTSHFDEAIAQARTHVGSLSGKSTVSIVLAGPIAETVDGSPFQNLRKADEALSALAPVAGGANLESAIQQAKALLKRTPGTRKQILLLTDDQLCNWESIDVSLREVALTDIKAVTPDSNSVTGQLSGIDNAEREASRNDSRPEIVCAAIVANIPKKNMNLSVDGLQIKSPFLTATRPVPIEVVVRNGGSTTTRDVTVRLLIDEREVASESLIQLEPNASTTVRFSCVFPSSGQHVVTGAIELSDHLLEDNRFDSVVDVTQHLSVLVVNGSTDSDPAQQSATFAQLALDPTSLRESPMGNDTVDLDTKNAVGASSNRPIITTAISAIQLGELESLDDFHLVMLCDVPRLTTDTAERLASFVKEGGGLWVIPDEHADKLFYNSWRMPLTDEPIMPVQLVERTQWSGKAGMDGRVTPLGVAFDVAGRPFISDLFERGSYDLEHVTCSQFWSMASSEKGVVDMRLTSGDILFAEQTLGQGSVLTQSISLGRRDSTFPATLSFPVLMHLWTYQLAASHAEALTIEPSADLVTSLRERIDSAANLRTLQLKEPGGLKREIPVLWEEGSPFAQVGRAVVPGVYEMNQGHPEAPVASFAVHRDRNESDLVAVSDERLGEISRDLGIELIDDVSELTAMSNLDSIGTEIWDELIFTVLWLLAAESLVTKWVRGRRAAANAERGDRPSRQSLGPQWDAATERSPRWQKVPMLGTVGEPALESLSGGQR